MAGDGDDHETQRPWIDFREDIRCLYGIGKRAMKDIAYAEFVPQQVSKRREPGDVMSRTFSGLRLFAKTFGAGIALGHGLGSEAPVYLALGSYLCLDAVAIGCNIVRTGLSGRSSGVYEQPATSMVEFGYFLVHRFR